MTDVGRLRRAGTGGSPPECPGRSPVRGRAGQPLCLLTRNGPRSSCCCCCHRRRSCWNEVQGGRGRSGGDAASCGARTRLPAVLMALRTSASVRGRVLAGHGLCALNMQSPSCLARSLPGRPHRHGRQRTQLDLNLRRQGKTRGGWGVFLPRQPDGYWRVFSGLTGPKPAYRTGHKCFDVFWGVLIEPENYTSKPAQTWGKTLAPNWAWAGHSARTSERKIHLVGNRWCQCITTL
jgi:hypothetical protein